MRKSIKITVEARLALQKAFDCSQQYIWYVLNYVKNGKTASAIRKAALELGGVYTSRSYTPNCHISHIGSDVIQDFGEDIILTINRKTGAAAISDKGRTVATVSNVNLDGWAAMAEMAERIARDRMLNN